MTNNGKRQSTSSTFGTIYGIVVTALLFAEPNFSYDTFLCGSKKGRFMNMSIQYESIGKRIKKFRMERNLSQEKLAEMIAVYPHHISQIENGRRIPSVETLILIANALSVSVDAILIDTLVRPHSPADVETIKIVADCNEEEQKMLMKILQFMKALLKEFGI